MGQMAEIKMTQMAAGLAALNTSKPIGSHASGETGRNKLIIGAVMRFKNSKRPIIKPSGMPTTAAKPKPKATRCNELTMFQPMP